MGRCRCRAAGHALPAGGRVVCLSAKSGENALHVDRNNPSNLHRRPTMNTPISSMMTSPAHAVGMDDTLEAIETLMTRRRLSWVPVVGPNETIIGVIALSDLLQSNILKNDPSKVAAWQICSYKPISVGADTSVIDVARLMVEHKIHHVVVMRAGSMVGVVSALDFVRHFALESERTGDAQAGTPDSKAGP
jgi:CBS domain-containing protein